MERTTDNEVSMKFAAGIMAAIALLAAASSVSAQKCRQYLPGLMRFERVRRDHPGAEAKLDRCRQEAQQMGLSARKGGRPRRHRRRFKGNTRKPACNEDEMHALSGYRLGV
jgi:hypothetical protein